MGSEMVTQQPGGPLKELEGLEEWGNLALRMGIVSKNVSGAQAQAIILTGREMGLPPMQALRCMYFSDGKINMLTQLQYAQARKLGVKLKAIKDEVDKAGNYVSCTVTLARGEEEVTTSYSMKDAQLAGLLALETVIDPDTHKPAQRIKKDNWRKNPRPMCQWRAIGSNLKLIAPEVCLGVYDPDELAQDAPAEGGKGKGWAPIPEKPEELKPVQGEVIAEEPPKIAPFPRRAKAQKVIDLAPPAAQVVAPVVPVNAEPVTVNSAERTFIDKFYNETVVVQAQEQPNEPKVVSPAPAQERPAPAPSDGAAKRKALGVAGAKWAASNGPAGKITREVVQAFVDKFIKPVMGADWIQPQTGKHSEWLADANLDGVIAAIKADTK